MNNKIDTLFNEAEDKLKNIFKNIDKVEELNSMKVLNAFRECNVTENCFNMTTGYGYNDIGRDTIERVFANIFKAEDALVRCQFISGTHAISTCLWGCLRPNDVMLSITGKPYDTLDEVIGIANNDSSLMSFGIKYMQVDLVDNDFDYDRIKDVITNNKIKLIEIQRRRDILLEKVLILIN